MIAWLDELAFSFLWIVNQMAFILIYYLRRWGKNCLSLFSCVAG